jgi:predicted O-methyltransferase YrrM
MLVFSKTAHGIMNPVRHQPFLGMDPVRDLGELFVDAEDRLAVSDEQTGEILGEMATLRVVGEDAVEIPHGLLDDGWKGNDSWHGITPLQLRPLPTVYKRSCVRAIAWPFCKTPVITKGCIMVPPLENVLRTIADFLSWQKRFCAVEGFLHDLEGYTLLQLAAIGGGVGAVVEIGSYLGRSTAFLAAGSKSTSREKVVAVDHFRGSPEQQAGQAYASATLLSEGTTLHRFQDNLRQLGLEDAVTPLVASSVDAAGQWTGPIRLLFIDADHSYAESRQDFDLWSQFVVPQGLVCFHDIGIWPGVTQFYEELLLNTTEFREVGAILSLRIIEKLTPHKDN